MASFGPSLPPDLIEARKTRLKARETYRKPVELSDPLLPEAQARTEDRRTQRKASGEFPPSEVQVDATPRAQWEGDDDNRHHDEHKDDNDDDEDDEEIGPMLPGAEIEQIYAARKAPDQMPQVNVSDVQQHPGSTERPEWMLAPPVSGDWAKNIDTTKLKSRSFATSRPGRPAIADPQQPSSAWTSTPGVRSATDSTDSMDSNGERSVINKQELHDDRERQKVVEHSHNSSRGASLFKQHNEKRRKFGDDEDDVSKRSFDREKDIGSNTTFKKTKSFADKSKNFDSMFDTGKFL